MTREEVLKTEWSEQFETICKNMMIVSFDKYGPVAENYKEYKETGIGFDSIKCLEKRLEIYKETGDMKFLADIANYAMIEFMYPQHVKAHYDNMNNKSCEVVGFGVNEIKDFGKIYIGE